MRKIALLASLALALAAAPGTAQKKWGPPASFFQPPGAIPQEIDYGTRFWEEVQYYPPDGATPAPLVAFLVDGAAKGRNGWAGWARYRMHEAGYAVVFIPFHETVPNAEHAVQNYAKALAFLRGKAAELKLDPDRIVLFGSGMSVHYAALLGTDPAILETAGVPFASIRGVAGIGGVGFDIPKRARENAVLKTRYGRLFGKDENDQRRLSPAAHLDPPNAPAFLLLAEEDDRDARPESEEMVQALAAAGTNARFVALPDVIDKMRASYPFAEPGGSAKEVLPFLSAQLGK